MAEKTGPSWAVTSNTAVATWAVRVKSMAEPTQGFCTGAVAFEIDKGHCDGVSLDGMKVVATFYFPRAIHHGDGHMQLILEDGISDEQRDAMFYILSGEDQPVGTMIQIFSIIVEHNHSPVFTKIDFDWDIKARTARVEVPGLSEGALGSYPKSADGRGAPHDHRVARRLGVP